MRGVSDAENIQDILTRMLCWMRAAVVVIDTTNNWHVDSAIRLKVDSCVGEIATVLCHEVFGENG